MKLMSDHDHKHWFVIILDSQKSRCTNVQTCTTRSEARRRIKYNKEFGIKSYMSRNIVVEFTQDN